MDSKTLPAFLQTHLLECRFLADPNRYTAVERFQLRNGRTSFELTKDEEKDADLVLTLLKTDDQAEEAGLIEVDKGKDRILARRQDEAREIGEALAARQPGPLPHNQLRLAQAPGGEARRLPAPALRAPAERQRVSAPPANAVARAPQRGPAPALPAATQSFETAMTWSVEVKMQRARHSNIFTVQGMTRTRVFGDMGFRRTVPDLDDALSLWDFGTHSVIEPGSQSPGTLATLREFLTYRSAELYPKDWDATKRPLLRRWINNSEGAEVLLFVALMLERVRTAMSRAKKGVPLSKKRRVVEDSDDNA